MNYQTADSRLCAYLLTKGQTLTGTDTKFQANDDRVYFTFEVDENRIAELKREFFEGAASPALELLNAHKNAMHLVRQARELAREYR